jgi:2-polyprenyl-6-methoxyphenol hydroxylase-like FAD-dependent oxidoreductase
LSAGGSGPAAASPGALRIAVAGCGTAGPAAALLLRRAGHDVTVYERFEDPRPVGAGILVQPTGMAVLDELGLGSAIREEGARVERLHGATAGGRTVLDLRYSDLEPGLHGLGLHRGALFATLHGALEAAKVPIHLGCALTGIDRDGDGAWLLAGEAAERHGPYDLVVVADGARSALRGATGIPHRVRPYPWGAVWAIAHDAAGEYGGVLAQTYRGTRGMAGFLPTGREPESGMRVVSLFWSLRADAVAAWRAAGTEAWKAQVLALEPRAAVILDQVGDIETLTFAAYHDVRMRRWHGDRVVMLGDAGHAMSPQLGQGANLALVDASALARALAEHGDVPSALAAYSRARRANLLYYGAASRGLTPLFQSSLGALGPPRDALMGPACRFGPTRRLMLSSLAGRMGGSSR